MVDLGPRGADRADARRDPGELIWVRGQCPRRRAGVSARGESGGRATAAAARWLSERALSCVPGRSRLALPPRGRRSSPAAGLGGSSALAERGDTAGGIRAPRGGRYAHRLAGRDRGRCLDGAVPRRASGRASTAFRALGDRDRCRARTRCGRDGAARHRVHGPPVSPGWIVTLGPRRCRNRGPGGDWNRVRARRSRRRRAHSPGGHRRRALAASGVDRGRRRCRS